MTDLLGIILGLALHLAVRGASMAYSPSDWTLLDSKIVTPAEVSRILSGCKELGEFDRYWGEVVYDWLVIAFNTGWRVSEVAHIEKSDILPQRVLITRRKKRRLHPEPVEVMPEVYRLLKARADAVEEGFIFPGRQAPCFIQHQSKENGASNEQVCVGGHASIRNIQRRFRLLIEDLGLYQYGRGIHVGRHFSITEIYRLTKDLRKAQVFAGHSSSTITERYAHIVDLGDTLSKMKVML
jgi:integrase